MYEELQTIENEKTYWLERLTRTTKEIKTKKTKKKRRIDPVKKDTFARKNKIFINNRSLLLDAGLLTLNNNSLEYTKNYNRARSMRDAKDSWDKPDDPHPSFNKRLQRTRAKTIYGSESYEMNLANTIGGLCVEVNRKAMKSPNLTRGNSWRIIHYGVQSWRGLGGARVHGGRIRSMEPLGTQ
jgi:hypothetical protein